jgi:hypothetical protein
MQTFYEDGRRCDDDVRLKTAQAVDEQCRKGLSVCKRSELKFVARMVY